MTDIEALGGDKGCRGIPWPKTQDEVAELLAKLVALRARALVSPLRWRMEVEAKAAVMQWALATVREVRQNLLRVATLRRSRRESDARVMQALLNADYFGMRHVFAEVSWYVPMEEGKAALLGLGAVRWIRRPREASE